MLTADVDDLAKFFLVLIGEVFEFGLFEFFWRAEHAVFHEAGDFLEACRLDLFIRFAEEFALRINGSEIESDSVFAATSELDVEFIGHLLDGVEIEDVLAAFFVFDKVSGKESLGGGDIKILFVVGLYLGFACSFFNLILSCILGLVFVAAMKKKRIPFGPAISLAAYVTLLIGSFVINWYIGLF